MAGDDSDTDTDAAGDDPDTGADAAGAPSTGEEAEPDADPAALAARVAELERTVDRLRDRLAARERDHALMAAKADLEAVSPTCPDCGEGTLRTTSGLTWKRAECPECDAGWYL